MTFTQIRQRVLDQCNLSSSEASTRVGNSINQHYRRITALLGLDPVRFVTRSVTTTAGQQNVTFTEIEKIDRILDTTTSTAINPLTEVSIHRQRTTQPGTGAPTTWALRNTDADSVVILMDTVPQDDYDLQADGTSTLGDMSGSDEPVFPESFHDILSFTVIAEELLKKEKADLADRFDKKAEKAISDLRFTLADSPTLTTRQGSALTTVGGGGGTGGGAGTLGGTAYTQTALLTFDRGAGIVPFAVQQSDAPYVANLGAEFLGNITTDRLIGRDTAGTGESEQLTVGGGLEFTGSGGIRIADAGVTYAKIQDVSAASKLLGRGSAAGAGDVEQITLGTGLSMSGTTLSASGVAGSDTQVQFNDGGALAGDAGLTYNKTTDRLTAAGGFTTTAGNNYLGDTSNANMTQGLTLNQDANDDEILAFKSSDIAHGVTGIAETDTFGTVRKYVATTGGTVLDGITEDLIGLALRGTCTNGDTGKTSSARAAVEIVGRKKSGTGIADLGANENILAVANSNTATRFILDADGDSHQDVGTAWTNFDDGDDLARLDAVAVTLAREGDPLREDFLQHFEEHRAVIEAMPGKPLVSFNDNGHHFVNMSRLTMLLTGAVRQLARENKALLTEMTSMKQRLLNGSTDR